ncbi:MAG: outer membrane beta-barrel protein [Bacteroidota bacterium]
MNTRLFLYVLVLTFIIVHAFPAVASAQDFQGGANFLIGIPQGEFRSTLDNTGIGLGVDFAYTPTASPFAFGAEFGFLLVGQETREEPFSTTIPDVKVDVTTSNNMVLGNLFVRVQPSSGLLRPYLEALGGFHYLYTDTKIENQRDGEEVASSTNFSDLAWSYGAGGGVMIKVYEPDPDEYSEPQIGELLIDFRLRYRSGGKAEYLQEGSIRREGGQITYDVSRSKTDLLTVQIGVTIRF